MPSAFRLEVSEDRLATLTFHLPGSKANIFNAEVFAELETLIGELAGRKDEIGCLILLSDKPGMFIAGADVDQISDVTDPAQAEEGSRLGHRVFEAWSQLPFPTIAAIRGVCMGGGTELSLASTYRVVSDDESIRIGLPEIRLGILPGWGGCVRLPQVIGLAPALDIILAGKSVRPKKALRLGLVDALLPDAAFRDRLREFALERRGSKRKADGGTDLKELLLEKNPLGRRIVFDQARKKTLEQTKGHYPAPLRAIEVIRIGIEDGPRAGFDAEARAIGELATSPTAKNLIHVFHLMEGVKKSDNQPPGEVLPIREAAVLGAGVMGGGIAQLIADKADLPVRLKDISTDALAAGMEHAAGLYAKKLRSRYIKESEARRKMTLLHPTLDYTGFERADIVVEAVIEIMEIKQDVFAEVAANTPEGAVLASNTSSLSIDEIGAKTPDRGRVVGMHFFNPVHKMPLVEVIAGEQSSHDAVRTVFDFSRRLGKTPVLVKDGPGFLVNRLLMFYSAEALWLLDEGHTMEDLDRAMTEWGMPMGPVALTDEVGIDVAVKVAHILQEAFSERLPLPDWLDRTAEDKKRLGAKTGWGFYKYDEKGRRTEPDPSAYDWLGVRPRIESPDLGGLAERMVLPMVNEAARCLAEGVVRSPGDLDLAMIMGTGFPPFRGGLCRWADSQGLRAVIDRLERLADTVGERYRPAAALGKAAEQGGFYATDWG